MPENLPLRKELKEKFIEVLTPYERGFFLKKAVTAFTSHEYPGGEDLFYYCYFSILKERFHGIDTERCVGFMRSLSAEGAKDIEETVKMYEESLE